MVTISSTTTSTPRNLNLHQPQVPSQGPHSPPLHLKVSLQSLHSQPQADQLHTYNDTEQTINQEGATRFIKQEQELTGIRLGGYLQALVEGNLSTIQGPSSSQDQEYNVTEDDVEVLLPRIRKPPSRFSQEGYYGAERSQDTWRS